MAFAAICDVWTAPGGLIVQQVATVTCPPSADVSDVHDRMGVVINLNSVGIWLDGSQAEAAKLMLPLDAGLLNVEQVTDVARRSREIVNRW